MEFYIRSYLRTAPLNHTYQLVEMIAKFRQSLLLLNNIEKSLDLKDAKFELDYYIDKGYPIYIAISKNEDVIGYIVIKEVDELVWAESLYVDSEWRRKGVAGELFDKAVMISNNYVQETVYVWVHPNNHKMIQFLAKRGYDVLNLIEVRKQRSDEDIQTFLKVGNNSFRYQL